MRRRLILLGSTAGILARAARAQRTCFDAFDRCLGNSLNAPSLDLQFLASTLDSRITLTRAAGGATYFDNTGTLQLASANAGRFDYDPSTLAPRGLLIEESRVNSIRNPRCEGAVIGTPGTYPTNFSQSQNTGLVPSVIGFGYEQGIPYVDIQLVGTAGAGNNNFFFENASGIVASNSQVWTESCYLRVTAGSLANIASIVLGINDNSGGGNGSAIVPTGAALATQRSSYTRTLSASGVTTLSAAFLQINPTAGAVNLTLRIGCPQLELGAFATSPILPAIGTPAATARAADVGTMPITGWYNAAAGSIAAEWLATTAPTAGTQGGIARLDDATDNNRILLFLNATSGTVGFSSRAATVDQLIATFASGLNAVTRGGGSYSGAAWAATAAGSAVSTAAGVAPSGITRLILASTSGGTSWFLNGWLRRIRYWPRALSNGELQQVTT